jgi:hypothetical protein
LILKRRRIKNRWVLIALVFLSSTGFSQFNETIGSGRPGQSIGPFTVGKGIFQIQSGVDYFKRDEKMLSLNSSGFLSNTVFRLGLTEPFEVSALVEYRTEEISENNSTRNLSGWTSIDLGMRYHIYSGSGLVPSVGFQIRGRLPVGGDYKVNQLAPRFILATSQALSSKFTFVTNWGASWNGNDENPRGNYTLNLSFACTDRLGVFIENYGGVLRSEFDTYLDGGLAFLVNNDLQLDILSGFGLNKSPEEFFISLGISWRTKRNLK